MAEYCSKCGAVLPDGAKFCMKCGEKVERQIPVSDRKKEPQQNRSEGKSHKKTASSSIPKTKKPENKNTSGGIGGKLLILVLAAVLAFTGFVYPGFLRDKKESGGTEVIQNDTPKTESPDKKEYETLSYKKTGQLSPDADRVTLTVSDCLVEEAVEYSVTPLSSYISEGGESEVYRYDISSDQIKGNVNGFMEIRIPYDEDFFAEGEDPARCMSVHAINDDGSFELELFDVDEVNKEVVIYAEHLSERQLFHYRDELRALKYDINFGNAFVGNLSLEDYTKAFEEFIHDIEMDPESWDTDYRKWADTRDGLIELAMGAMYGTLVKVFPEGLNAQLYDSSMWLGNAANILALGGQYTQSYMNRGMTMLGKLGIYTSMCKLSYEFFKHKNDGGDITRNEVLSLYKTYINTALDYVSYYQTGTIVPMVSMYMSGVFVFGLFIDSMFEEARYMKMEDMGAVYEYFGDSFKSGDYKPRTNLEWYEIFMDIIDRYCASGKQEYIPDAVEREIRLYAEEFWKLPSSVQSEVITDAGYKRMPYPTESEIEELTNNYINNLTYRLHPVMYECESTMTKRNQKAVLDQLRKTYSNLNTKTTLQVVDGNEKVIYAGYWFKFRDLKKEADKKIWQGQLDKKGRFEAKFNLNDWIFAGVPTRVDLYRTEKDMEKGKNPVTTARIVLGKKNSDPSTVMFVEPEDVTWVLDALVYKQHTDNYDSCPAPSGLSTCSEVNIECTESSCHLGVKSSTYISGKLMEEREGYTYAGVDLTDVSNPPAVVTDPDVLNQWISGENKARGFSSITVHMPEDQDYKGYMISVGDTDLVKGSFTECWPEAEEGKTVYVMTTWCDIGYLFRAVNRDGSSELTIKHIDADPEDYLYSDQWRH